MSRLSKCLFVVLLVQPCVAKAEIAVDDSFYAFEQQLRTVTSLHLSDVPLSEALDTLGKQVGVQFVLDMHGLDDLGLEPNDPVSISVDNVSLETFLELLLKPFDLTYVPRRDIVMVTSEEEALREMVVRIYPVPDLLGTAEEQAKYGGDYDTIIDAIISVIDSDTWVENGGPEAEIRPFPAAKAIVVSQTFQTHRKIERLLADLRRLRVAQGLPVARDHRPTPFNELPGKTYVSPAHTARLPQAYSE